MAFFNCLHFALFNCSTETNRKHVKGSRHGDIVDSGEKSVEFGNGRKYLPQFCVKSDESQQEPAEPAAAENCSKNCPVEKYSLSPFQRQPKCKNNANLSSKCNAHAHKFSHTAS